MDPDDNQPSVGDPKENPVQDGHLPVSGEVGAGQVPDHDPLTADTDDNPDSALDLPTTAADD